MSPLLHYGIHLYRVSIPLNTIQDVVASYKKLTADGKARVPDTNGEFAKQFVPALPENHLANEIKNDQSKQ